MASGLQGLAMREITYALESIEDRSVMESFIKRQDIDGCSILINVLRYTDEEVEKRWTTVYSEVFKY